MTLTQLIFCILILGLLPIVIFAAWTSWMARQQWVRDELAERYGKEHLQNHGGVEAEQEMMQIERVIGERPSAQVIPFPDQHSGPQN